MVLTTEVEHEAEKLRKELASKGISVIDDSQTNNRHSNQELTLEARASPIQIKDTRTETRIISENKFRSLYDFLIDSGLYINASMDLDFGARREIPLDDAAESKLVLAEESYNSTLTFTILTSILQNSCQLSFGPPGSGKTTASEFVISAVYNLPLSDIQEATILGNPELTEEKMVAYLDLSSFLKHEEIIGVRKFMTLPGRILDEANRMRPSTSSLLLNLIDRGWAIYNSKKVNAVPGPLFATVNGQDDGNYEMTPAFLDRFDVGVISAELNPAFVQYFAESRNNKIRFLEDKIVRPPKQITSKDIIQARKEIYNVSIDSKLMNKLAYFLAEVMSCDKAGMNVESKTKGNALYMPPGPLCKDCRYFTNDDNLCHTTENSLSARTISTIYAYSKSLSWWRGKSQVSEEDLKQAVAYASWFKLRPTRNTKEKEPGFINDRKEMIKELWGRSSQTYSEVLTAFPGYENIVSTVTNYHRGIGKPSRSDLEDMMHSLCKIDSPSKFPIAAALKEMYQNHDRTT